jgi:hypothetical protein
LGKCNKTLKPADNYELLESTNEKVYEIFRNLDPFAESVYPVSWAGEKKSYNWFDIAREYTERWLHQQQIRDASGDKEIMIRQLYHPFLDIFMYAWPAIMQGQGKVGMVLKTTITGEGGGVWLMEKKSSEGAGKEWMLRQDVVEMETLPDIHAETIISGPVAWKLFSKSVRKEDIKESYEIKGDQELGERVLDMISVMA